MVKLVSFNGRKLEPNPLQNDTREKKKPSLTEELRSLNEILLRIFFVLAKSLISWPTQVNFPTPI